MVSGLWKNLRLVEDAYYEIDIDNEGVQVSRNDSASSVGYTIDCSAITGDQRKNFFSKVDAVKLAEVTDTASLIEFQGYLESFPDAEESFIRINDVKQGNWNEFHLGGAIPIVYDIGTNRDDTHAEIRTTANTYISQYSALPQKPAMIISHWDVDHYNCLLQLTSAELTIFSYVLCTRELPNSTAQKAYLKLSSTAGLKIISIPTKSTSRSKRFPVESNVFSSRHYSLYQGIGNDRNTRGLVLSIRQNNSVSFLTGDAAWYQLSHIVREEAINFANVKEFNLVLPHHGSGKDDTYKGFVIPTVWDYGNAGISVSRKHNKYGHPSATVIDFMKSKFGSLKRTDKVGSSIDIVL